jgi:hypothetical protein
MIDRVYDQRDRLKQFDEINDEIPVDMGSPLVLFRLARRGWNVDVKQGVAPGGDVLISHGRVSSWRSGRSRGLNI